MEDVKRAWDLYEQKVSEADDAVLNNSKASSKEVRGVWAQQVSTIVTDFSKGVTDIFAEPLRDIASYFS